MEQDVIQLDVAVVGAGFAGLYLVKKLRDLSFSVKAFDAESDIGGTWLRNRYPGLRCDVESLQYCYSFSEDLEEEWDWTERFSPRDDILHYINYVADRFDLRRDVQLNTRIVSAHFQDQDDHWLLRTEQGGKIRSRFCIMATGCLSDAHLPKIAGMQSFDGTTLHTANWPSNRPDLKGKKVGVLGTGSSGVQIIPELAEEAGQLYVFQRTPAYVVPARNAAISDEQKLHWKANFRDFRRIAKEKSATGSFMKVPQKSALAVSPTEREEIYAKAWERGGPEFTWVFSDLVTSDDANETAGAFVRQRIRETVRNPEVAERLTPRSYPIFSKRICVGTNYYETFNRENVTLVDLREAPIVEMTAAGLRTENAFYDLDVMVFATGYDAFTGALKHIDIRGAGRRSLSEAWQNGPTCYLGIMAANFPNLFFITGPGSPSVLSNVVISIEQHVEWIADCLTKLREMGVSKMEATKEAEAEWQLEVQRAAAETVYTRAQSWYSGANVEGKPNIFLPYAGGVGRYRAICNDVVRNNFQGFVLTKK
ncbi:MAG: flavin-containing monooxygenase [Flavobacteriaceae bacterium]